MQRPWYLTGWLILLAIGGVFSLYSYTLGSAAITAVMPDLPSWYLTAMLVLAVVQLVGVYMLWQWKMLGFQLMVGATVVASVLNYMYLGFGAVVMGLIGLGILYLVMKTSWKNFK